MVKIEPVSGNSSTPPASPSSCSSGPPPLPNTFPYPTQESPLAFPGPVSWPIQFYPQNPYSYGFGYGYGFGFGYGYPKLPPPELYDLNYQPWVQPPVPAYRINGGGTGRMGNSGRVSGFGGGHRIGLEKGTTTLMIRNLPSKMRRDELMNLLDEHCREENKSAPRLSPKHQSTYDFLYLPFDFVKKGNLGYAFVNFTTGRAAFKFFKCWSGRGWMDLYRCSKICAITRADIQGKEASRRHLQESTFYCKTEEYLPVEFSPPRNGYNAAMVTIETFGIRVYNDRVTIEIPVCNKDLKMKSRKTFRKKVV